MAGPISMALGPFMFRAHGFGYSDVSRSLNTPWAEISTTGRFNQLQWTGPQSESLTINGAIFPKEFGGLTTLEGVRLAAKSGLPLMLVSLGGRVFGRHAIQSISEEHTFHDRFGIPAKNSYNIQLRNIGAGLTLQSILRGLNG